jgi:hypothetical protein
VIVVSLYFIHKKKKAKRERGRQLAFAETLDMAEELDGTRAPPLEPWVSPTGSARPVTGGNSRTYSECGFGVLRCLKDRSREQRSACWCHLHMSVKRVIDKLELMARRNFQIAHLRIVLPNASTRKRVLPIPVRIILRPVLFLRE